MRRKFYFFVCVLLVTCGFKAEAQLITISTGLTSSNYSFGGAPVAQTFGIRNNNNNQVILMEIDYNLHVTANNGLPYKLYYSSTSLTGTVSGFPGTAWTLIAQNTINSPAGVANIFNNLNFVIPANTVYRFALQCGGTSWSSTSTPSPNTFSNSGVDLLTHLNGVADGYAGFITSSSATLSSGPMNYPGTIRLIPGYPCSGKPGPSVVVGPEKVCPNDTFTQTCQSGVGFVLDQEYQWQYSYNGITWSNYTGAGYNSTSISDAITTTKYYRTFVKCKNSGLYDTTSVKKVVLAPFYNCYCKSKSVDTGLNTGNVKIIDSISDALVLDNGVAIPLTANSKAKMYYTAFWDSVKPVKLYRDTTYRVIITKIHPGIPFTGYSAMFIDFNRDGIYDQFTERVFDKAVTNPLTGRAEDTFRVPKNAAIGLTGMRVVMSASSPANPCGNYGKGETEDYLVDLSYEPCTGPVDPGTIGGDTSVCVGYDYLLTDTSYEHKKSDIEWNWQVSGDDINWSKIAGSGQKDTLMRVFNGQPLYYRTQMRCPNTKDTTYSSSFRVNLKAGYKCYCFSQAIGGMFYDSSDIGSLSIADYFNSDGGPHLQNGIAHQKRTDHTDEAPIDIDVDSVYDLKVFHTQWNPNHGDAKLTVFMDFNNNHIYDIPQDRIYTGYTSLGLYTLVDKAKVDPLAILDVPTGMRVILNNNIAPNIPSDEACGTYGSGETEDYLIVFRKKFPAGVGTISGISALGLYPNPTTGKFILSFKAENRVDKISIRITNVTGQELQKMEYGVNGSFTKEIDLGNASKGIYFVELSSGEQKIIRKMVLN